MAQAPNYTPTTSFSNDETNNASGRSTVRTVSVDAEFANVSTSVNAINTNLQKLQRDDGNLLDFIVEPFALSDTTRALLTGGQIRGDWAPYTVYAQGDITRASGAVYIALNNHTSGPTFVSTLWMSLSQSGDALAAANAASAAAAQASSDAAAATAATASKLDKVTGGTMAAPIVLSGDATLPLHAVPMRQAVLLSTDQTIGGIKTFGLPPVLPGNAANALEAIPKQQLDAEKFGRLLAVRIFTTSGTYTPTAGTSSVVVEAVGGGGGGGGCGATAGGQVCAAGGGGSGAYGKSRFTTGFSGVAMTIGAAGAGAAAGNNNGGNGGATSFGALLSCPGGGGGLGGGGNSPAAPYVNTTTAAAAAPTGANLVSLSGSVASYTFAATYGSFSAGQGGSNPLGTGGMTFGVNTTAPGVGYGSGASGSYIGSSTAALAGAAGAPGAIIVSEYA